MNASCCTYMRHVSHFRPTWVQPHGHHLEWVMTRANESFHIGMTSRHIRMHHVTHKWVMSPDRSSNELCHLTGAQPHDPPVKMRSITQDWVMAHVNTSRHIWICHANYEYATSHMNTPRYIWIRHVNYKDATSNMNQSRQIWRSHVKHVWRMWNDEFIFDVSVCGIMDSYLMFPYVEWRIRIWCLTWLLYIWRVKYESIIPHTDVSCHIWMSHVAYQEFNHKIHHLEWLRFMVVGVTVFVVAVPEGLPLVRIFRFFVLYIVKY